MTDTNVIDRLAAWLRAWEAAVAAGDTFNNGPHICSYGHLADRPNKIHADLVCAEGHEAGGPDVSAPFTMGDLREILDTLRNGPSPIWARQPELSPLEACKEAYGEFVAARAALEHYEQAYRRAVNGGRS